MSAVNRWTVRWVARRTSTSADPRGWACNPSATRPGSSGAPWRWSAWGDRRPRLLSRGGQRQEIAMSGARILIVEDEASVARDLADRLAALGYTVAGTTPSGEEAVRIGVVYSVKPTLPIPRRMAEMTCVRLTMFLCSVSRRRSRKRYLRRTSSG